MGQKAKISYFNMTGLGEPVRLMLAVNKIDFEDNRVTSEEWSELKPKTKWHQLPMLEIDGKILYQSMSICRYLARRTGLCGSTADDAFDCDMTVDALDDMRAKIAVHYYQLDSRQRDEGLKNAKTVKVPFYLNKFEDQLSGNEGYLACGELTWADIIFLSHTDYISHLLREDILSDFPKLKKHHEKIAGLPGIKEWLAKRPEDPKDFRSLFGL